MYIKDQDGIISFELLKAEVNRKKLCRCQDASYTLDVNNRLVICDQCGAIIDPFDALLKIVDKQREWEEYQIKARLRTVQWQQADKGKQNIFILCVYTYAPGDPGCNKI